jgi:hypothetical protein
MIIDSAKSYAPPPPDSSLMTIHHFPDSVLQEKITLRLMQLPFVKKSDAYIDSFSHHQHGMAFMMDKTGDNEVTVNVGYNGELRFESYYWFKVNSKTFDIKVYDPINDTLLTVQEYLKNHKD